MKKVAMLISIIVLVSVHSHADDLNFQSSAEGIIQGLTREKAKKKVKTRGLSAFNQVKTRSITVALKDGAETVFQNTLVTDETVNSAVKLKIEFDVNSSTVRNESFPLLDELGKALASDTVKNEKIKIKGHTDSDGSEKHNLRLSVDRALTVKNYLVEKLAINESRLKVIGYGEAMPLVPNDDDMKKQTNRRVEIEIDTSS